MRYISLLLALLVPLTAHAQRRCGPGGYDQDVAQLPISQRLERVIVGDITGRDCDLAMIEAAATADTTYRSVLRRIVQSYSAPDPAAGPIRNYFVVRPALYALHELGEPQDYFVPFVLNHRRNDLLAEAALKALASDPDSTFWASVKPMWANLDSLTSGLSGGLSHYAFMIEDVRRHARAQPVEVRVERAVRMAVSLYSFPRAEGHYAYGESVGGDALDADVVWWSRELRSLNRSHPNLVQAAVERYTTHARDGLAAANPPVPAQIGAEALAEFGTYMTTQRTRPDYRLDHEPTPDPAPAPAAPLILPGALAFEAPATRASFSADLFRLDGRTHTAAGTLDATSTATHGLAFPTATQRDAFLSRLGATQRDNITGASPFPDVIAAPVAFHADSLIARLLRQPTTTLAPSLSGTQTLGSATAPVVAVAPQGLTGGGTLRGHGVLVVDGTLSATGTVEWTGLVVVRNTSASAPALSASQTFRVVGGLLVVNRVAGTASLAASAGFSVLYSPEALRLVPEAVRRALPAR